jgi:hypothetical protein
MKRIPLLLLATTLWAGAAAAQYRGPRSADHLFATSTWGAPALWVNPLALANVDEASLMLEAMVERDPDERYPLAQYTIGFNSRGFGFGFRHDTFHVPAPDGDSLISVGGNTWRLGLGRGLGRLAIGAAVSLYSGADKQQDVDLGLRYVIARGLNVAIGVEHIGQPTVRDSSLRFGGAVGLSWTVATGVVGLDAEVRAHDRETGNGFLVGYRGGLRIRTPGRLPVAATGVIELDDGFDVRRVLLGLAVGADYLASLVAGGRENGSNTLTTASLRAQASRRFR